MGGDTMMNSKEKILWAVKKIIPRSLFNRLSPIYHFVLNAAAAFWYGYPSRGLTVIGVTGTNGKSTVVDLLANILEESGRKTASISSLRFKIGEKEWKNDLKMTMPGRAAIQKFLYQAKKEGARYAVIEVTSEGIRQFRHRNIKWHTLVFTNLTPEHVESHGGFENYKKAKGRLFAMPHEISVVNLDDEYAAFFLDFSAEKKYGYGVKHEIHKKGQEFCCEEPLPKTDENLIAENAKISINGVVFTARGEEFGLPLFGEFNIYNALAAATAGLALGISLDQIKKTLSRAKTVPGRMEFIKEGQSFSVVVDYAHTPDSLEKVYETLRAIDSRLLSREAKLICVLGAAGGGRDKWKRQQFGKLAARFCDEVVITNEDPYDENPKEIMSEIELGFLRAEERGAKVVGLHKILDRREAIRKALSLARSGDTVVITGKGAETSIMEAGGKRIPWDDRAVAREEIQKLLRK